MHYSLNTESSLLHLYKCTNFLLLEEMLPGPPGLQFPFSEKLPKCVWVSLCISSSISLSVNSLQCGLYPYSLIIVHTQRSPVILPTAPIPLVCGKSWMCQPSFPKEILFSHGRGHHPALFLVSLTLLHSFLLFLVLTCPRFPKLNCGPFSPLTSHSLHWRSHWSLCLWILPLCSQCLARIWVWSQADLHWTNYVIPQNFSFICKNGIIKHSWIKALVKVLSSNVHQLMNG